MTKDTNPDPEQAPDDDESEECAAELPPLVRLGSLAFAAAAAALTASILPAARVADRVGGSLVPLVPVVAIAAFPFAIAGVALARGARDGLRALTRRGAGEPAPLLAPWLGALGVLVAVAIVFGTALFATTHHRGLAGATFALAFAIAATAVGLFTRRITRGLADATQTQPRVRTIIRAVSLAILGGAALVALRLFATLAPSAVTFCVQDASILIAAIALAASNEFRERRFAFAGPPLVVLVIAAGLFGAHPTKNDLASGAPLYPVELASRLRATP